MRNVILAISVAMPVVVCGYGVARAEDAEALFGRKCAACHSQKKVLDLVRKKPQPDRAAHLDRHLAAHFAPDPAERKALAAYLVEAAGKR